ncbi:glutathione S-transferase family protein [Mesorhizobium sp. CAU 1741]|uniref:glutathione S-transferase family protein n=1 Tax=Mesorhizobium sp. CAU 1741 TaxID=3140366 RepID=UPI00325ABAF8
MHPVITVFAASPDEGRGLARDMPVRWAMEEVGQRYEVMPVTFVEMKAEAHLARQPFGQIPVFEEGELVLFESGAIVLHIAEAGSGLLPDDASGRARVVAWMFAAVGSIEPVVVQRESAIYLEGDEPWHEERLAIVEDRIADRLGELARALGEADWLVGDFSAADILMVQILRRLEDSSLIELHANLSAYVERGKARPAFQRAFAAQKAFFERRYD